MYAEIKVKFLQHLNQKKQDQGFTLIELLVVIIIIGILSAIALPSFLSQSAKARASEARSNVGALNRAQQAYYFEHQTFTGTIADLGVGITDTANYAYESTAPSSGGLTTGVINKGKSLNQDLKGVIGAVFSTGGQTRSILCQAKQPALESTTPMDAPINLSGTPLSCNTSTTETVGK